MNELQQNVSLHASRSRLELGRDLERDHLRNQLAYEANVEVNGASMARPGSFIQIDGMGPSFDGHWVVIEARHVIAKNFVSALKVRRFLVSDKRPVPRRPTISGRKPSARLVKGQWRAAR
jgi:hypothetical protein